MQHVYWLLEHQLNQNKLVHSEVKHFIYMRKCIKIVTDKAKLKLCLFVFKRFRYNSLTVCVRNFTIPKTVSKQQSIHTGHCAIPVAVSKKQSKHSHKTLYELSGSQHLDFHMCQSLYKKFILFLFELSVVFNC